MMGRFQNVILAGFIICMGMMPMREAFAVCHGNDPCSADYQVIPPVRAYCGQGGKACTSCDEVKSSLQSEMDIHRQGGNRAGACVSSGAGTQPSFLMDTYWNGTVVPGLEGFLSNISTDMLAQTATRATFSDSQNSARSILALQEGQAKAAVEFMPSEALCRFGTLSQSLAADDAATRSAQLQIATVGMKRNLGAKNSIAESGLALDGEKRMDEFVSEFCNAGQNNNGLALMCGASSQRRFPSVERDTRYNHDINYTRTIDMNDTLDYSLEANRDLTPGEQDVIALGHNLYGSSQFSDRPTSRTMNTRKGQENYLKARSIVASREVAQNSYAAIAAMRVRGSGATHSYIDAMFQELGVPKDSVSDLLSDKPSYYAQMDVLTKKLYQDPTFYVNLMEGKTNVQRQSAAMEGIELMQDRDVYQSMRRSEMLLALLIQLQSHKLLADTAEDVKSSRH